MINITTPHYHLSFGDITTAFEKREFYGLASSTELLAKPHHEHLKNVGAITLIAPDQTHGTDGIIIRTLREAEGYTPYATSADFVVTNIPGVAIGIATADCVPIVMYDPCNHVIAITHAGWQGTINQIAQKTIHAMQAFGTDAKNVIVYFGPCASVAMYEVSEEFQEKLDPELRDATMQRRYGRWFFDMPRHNTMLLKACGVTHFNYEHNFCTISDTRFCSHRRQENKALRQMNCAMLKSFPTSLYKSDLPL